LAAALGQPTGQKFGWETFPEETRKRGPEQISKRDNGVSMAASQVRSKRNYGRNEKSNPDGRSQISSWKVPEEPCWEKKREKKGQRSCEKVGKRVPKGERHEKKRKDINRKTAVRFTKKDSQKKPKVLRKTAKILIPVCPIDQSKRRPPEERGKKKKKGGRGLFRTKKMRGAGHEKRAKTRKKKKKMKKMACSKGDVSER